MVLVEATVVVAVEIMTIVNELVTVVTFTSSCGIMTIVVDEAATAAEVVIAVVFCIPQPI